MQFYVKENYIYISKNNNNISQSSFKELRIYFFMI